MKREHFDVNAMKGHVVYLRIIEQDEKLANNAGDQTIATPKMRKKPKPGQGDFQIIPGSRDRGLKTAQHPPMSGRDFDPR